MPAVKSQAFITNTNKKDLSSFKPVACNPLVKRYETGNSTEYSVILNKQKEKSPGPIITRPKPNIAKGGVKTVNKEAKAEVCYRSLVLILFGFVCCLCVHTYLVFSFVEDRFRIIG